MLRAIRFSVTLDFRIEASTEEGIRELAPTITHVAAERIRQELEKMMRLLSLPEDGVCWTDTVYFPTFVRSSPKTANE